MNAFEIKNSIFWTGVLDPDLETFDIVMKTPHGSTYNSYLIMDQKNILIDTVKSNFKEEYLKKLNNLIDIKELDYVIINHTEPDHSGSLKYILEINPNIIVYCTKAASIFLKEQINDSFNIHIINDKEFLDIGSRKLTFITAPFLHWSDTMFVYSESDSILFSCDCYGSHHSSLDPNLVGTKEYMSALENYYNAIMRPFAQHYLNAHEKIKDLSIDTILTSHGPILTKDPGCVIKTYFNWSTEEMSKRNQKQVALIYLSAYRNTELMAEKIREGLESAGAHVVYIDAENESISTIHDAILTSKAIVLGSPTINKSMVSPMWSVFSSIDPMANMGKIASVFGSYGWGGEGIKMADSLLKQMGFKLPFEPLGKKFTPSEETLEKCIELGKNLAEKIS